MELLTFESCFAFFAESSHAFLLIIGAEQPVKQAAFEADPLRQRGFERGVDHFLVRDGGHWRHRGDGGSGFERFLEQAVVRHDAGD